MVLPLGADFTLESFASPWFCLLLAGNSRQRVRTSIVNVDQKLGGELGQSPLNKKKYHHLDKQARGKLYCCRPPL